MKLPPEAIDGAVIQLRGLLTTTEGIPEEVKTSGETFIAALDNWSEQLKKEQAK